MGTPIIQGNTDSYGFTIWTESMRNSKWDTDKTYQQLLLESKKEQLDPFEAMDNGVRTNEIGYHYVYGGILSERGGIFVVKRDNPTKIIRAIMTTIS